MVDCSCKTEVSGILEVEHTVENERWPSTHTRRGKDKDMNSKDINTYAAALEMFVP